MTEGEDQAAEAAPAGDGRRRRAYLPAPERRRRIILAAQEVFSRTNLHGARTNDIAKAADVNQATLFEHFASKEAIFFAAVVNPLVEAMKGMQDRARAYQEAGTLDGMLALSQVSVQRHLETMIDILPLLTASLFSDAEIGRKLYCEQIAPLLLQRGEVLEGLLREDIDPMFAGTALFGIFFAVALDQLFRGRGDTSELARQLGRFATSGFLKDGAK